MKTLSLALAAAAAAYVARGNAITHVAPGARNWDEGVIALETYIKQTDVDDNPFALEREERRKAAESAYAFELTQLFEELRDEDEPLVALEPDHHALRAERLARGDDWDGFGADEAYPGPAY